MTTPRRIRRPHQHQRPPATVIRTERPITAEQAASIKRIVRTALSTGTLIVGPHGPHVESLMIEGVPLQIDRAPLPDSPSLWPLVLTVVAIGLTATGIMTLVAVLA